MISAEDIDFVNLCLDSFYTQLATHKYGVMSPAKEPPYHPEDGGVPFEMMDSPVDGEGYCQWKMLPSTLTEADVRQLEQEFAVPFPPLLRAYLVARFHLIDQVGNGKEFMLWPCVPSDNPFGPLRLYLEGWKPLLEAGYIPFTGYQDDWGPVCFDTEQCLPDGDQAIVWFDHEVLHNFPDETDLAKRELVQPLARPLYSSFRELLSDMFLAQYAGKE
ncbi:MAG: hypothetical protein K1Y36_17660 [Blastocatellia bacterium]|nr:hypothetical protein [Blastocatellia bacterium]